VIQIDTTYNKILRTGVISQYLDLAKMKRNELDARKLREIHIFACVCVISLSD
jgi:hypothetical protein